jgi:hypothetical protein
MNMMKPRQSAIGLLFSAGAFALGATFAAPQAQAQVAGTSKEEPPNVLLLVDTSGSMERMSNGTMPTCTPGTETDPNRWGSLVQALTGTFQPGFSCKSQIRSAAKFQAEYRPSAGVPIYDENYELPYNRPLIGTNAADMCAITHNNVGDLVAKKLDTTTGLFGASKAMTVSSTSQKTMCAWR